MIRKQLANFAVGFLVCLFCLVGCKRNEQRQVDVVRNFIVAIESFDCEGLETADDPYSTEEFTKLSEAFQKYTTYTGVSEEAFTFMLCDLQFRNMVYEVVYHDDMCSVIKAVGEWWDGIEADAFEEEFVVTKTDKGWVIDLDAATCE